MTQDILAISHDYCSGFVFPTPKDQSRADIPEGVADIGSSAFSGCYKLQSVSLPSTLREIYPSAFSGASITEIHMAKNITYVGARAFARCPKLTRLSVDHEVTLTKVPGLAFSRTPLKEIVIAGVSYPVVTQCSDEVYYVINGTIKRLGGYNEEASVLEARLQLWLDTFMALPFEDLLDDSKTSTHVAAPPPSVIRDLAALRLKGLL